MARIVMVYNTERFGVANPTEMARIQLFETARSLARLGHDVDIATSEIALQLRRRPVVMADRLRRVPLSRVRWSNYDVIETNFHQGWESLSRYGGTSHPFIIAKLGSVVGDSDMAGIYYFGRTRERMFETQRAIHLRARYITLLSEAARRLWAESLGARDGLLLVPGGVAREIPRKGSDPFPSRDGIRILFSGNVYSARSQPEANRVLCDKLNALGQRLAAAGRVYVAGPGDTRRLDARYVTTLGAIPYDDAWQQMLHADVGIVVSAGPFMHNNESSKIYHYLRAGLPTVSEAGFPNDHVVDESGLGFVVQNNDMDTMAARILDAARAPWNREGAERYILANHTWERRMEIYAAVLDRHFPNLATHDPSPAIGERVRAE
jgi:glycosyltransferase involved in cell wall biosynthesis